MTRGIFNPNLNKAEREALACGGAIGSMLGLVVIIGMLWAGCHKGAEIRVKKEQEAEAQRIAAQVEKKRFDETPCTLIKSEILERERWRSHDLSPYPSLFTDVGAMYFDTDGNTNTVEVIATKRMPCAHARARFDFAKPGDTKTRAEWQEFLTHKGEESCRPEGRIDFNEAVHAQRWERL